MWHYDTRRKPSKLLCRVNHRVEWQSCHHEGRQGMLTHTHTHITCVRLSIYFMSYRLLFYLIFFFTYPLLKMCLLWVAIWALYVYAWSGGVSCVLLLFESLSVALMKAERAEVDFPTAICWEAQPLWVHHLPVLQPQSACFWVIMCRSVQKWPQLLVRLVTLGWGERVLQGRRHRQHRNTPQNSRAISSL